MSDFDLKYAAEYSRVSSLVRELDWHIPVFLTGKQHKSIEARIAAGSAGDSDHSKDDVIFRALFGVVVNPVYRARATYLWGKKDVLKHHSHFVEEAAIAFYSGLYASATALLIVALEGALTRLFPECKGKHQCLVKKLESATFRTLPRRGEIYRSEMVHFLDNRLFQDSRSDSYTHTSLSRHSFFHGAEAKRKDFGVRECTRMLLACELMLELVRCITGEDHTLLPDIGSDADLEERILAYRKMALDFINGETASRNDDLICSSFHRSSSMENQLPRIEKVDLDVALMRAR